MLEIVLFVLLTSLLYMFFTRNYNYWSEKGVTSEKPLPLIGNIAEVILGKTSMGMLVKKLYDKVNKSVPYFGLYIFQTPYLVLKCPELITQVLITDFNVFPNRPIYSNEKLDPMEANILIMMRNDAWRELRRKLTPIFTSAKLKMMFPLMKELTNELEDYVGGLEEKDIDVNDLFKRYAVDSISSCAFGINSNSIKKQNSEICAMVNRLFDMKKITRAISVFCYLYCPVLVEIFRFSFYDLEAAQNLANIFKKTSEEREQTKVKRYDLIDFLNSIQQEENENDLFKLDDMKKAAQAITFFSSGSESTTLIITYLFYELAINPIIQERLRAEILENIDLGGSISYETLSEMEYLDMVIKETLRKYPLSQMLFRRAERDYIFQKTGLTIKKGTPILIPSLALHLDPNHYPDPEKFDPERFRGNKRGSATFLSFGIGPRKCIATRFALTQMKIAVAMLLKKFEVALSKRTKSYLKMNMRSFHMVPRSGPYLTFKKAPLALNTEN